MEERRKGEQAKGGEGKYIEKENGEEKTFPEVTTTLM
jgi:hypothetical protein